MASILLKNHRIKNRIPVASPMKKSSRVEASALTWWFGSIQCDSLAGRKPPLKNYNLKCPFRAVRPETGPPRRDERIRRPLLCRKTPPGILGNDFGVDFGELSPEVWTLCIFFGIDQIKNYWFSSSQFRAIRARRIGGLRSIRWFGRIVTESRFRNQNWIEWFGAPEVLANIINHKNPKHKLWHEAYASGQLLRSK